MKDTIKRISLEEGNFATISNNQLFNSNLSDSSFRFIVYALNNKDGWELNFNQYKKIFGCSNNKMTRIKLELESLGILITTKTSTGRGGKFIYNYVIDENIVDLILRTPILGDTILGDTKMSTKQNQVFNNTINKQKEIKRNDIGIGIGSLLEVNRENKVEVGQQTNQPKIISSNSNIELDGVKIETEEQIKQLKKIIAITFKNEELNFKSEEEMNNQFSGFVKSLRNKNWMNGKGKFVDNWNSYSKMIVKGIIEGKYTFNFNIPNQPIKSFYSESSHSTKEKTAQLVEMLEDIVSEEELETFNSNGGAYSLLNEIRIELTFDVAMKLIFKDENGKLTYDILKKRFDDHLQGKVAVSGFGTNYADRFK